MTKERTGTMTQTQKPVLREWVCELGLRHQGVLVSAVRGPDGEHKKSCWKRLIRVYRGLVLHSYDENPSSFIKYASLEETKAIMRRCWELGTDHLPLHWYLHFIHAVEIVGYCHPDMETRNLWRNFYDNACVRMHMTPEYKHHMHNRLNATEDNFRKGQRP